MTPRSPAPMPAEACTELGFEHGEDARQSLFDRWPRAWPLVACVLLLVLYGLAGDPPPDDSPVAIGDGFPPELLAEQPIKPIDPEVQP